MNRQNSFEFRTNEFNIGGDPRDEIISFIAYENMHIKTRSSIIDKINQFPELLEMYPLIEKNQFFGEKQKEYLENLPKLRYQRRQSAHD